MKKSSLISLAILKIKALIRKHPKKIKLTLFTIMQEASIIKEGFH